MKSFNIKSPKSQGASEMKERFFGNVGNSPLNAKTGKLRQVSLPALKMSSLKTHKGYQNGSKTIQQLKSPLSEKASPLYQYTESSKKALSFMPGNHKVQSSSEVQNALALAGTNVQGGDADGWKRVRQQEFLAKVGQKPYDDYDKDGLANVLDCWPLDKSRQGATHSVDTKMSADSDPMIEIEDDSRVDLQREQEVYGPQRPTVKEAVYQKGVDFVEGTKQVGSKVKEAAYQKGVDFVEGTKQVGSKVAAVGAVVGEGITQGLTGKTKEQRMAIAKDRAKYNKEIAQAARQAKLKEVRNRPRVALEAAKVRAREEAKRKYARPSGGSRQSAFTNPQSFLQSSFKTVGRGYDDVVLSQGKLGGSFSFDSIVPKGTGVSSGFVPNQPLTPAQKIGMYTGKQQVMPQQQVTVAPVQQSLNNQVAQVQPTQYEQSTPMQQPESPQGGVYSPSSRRIVGYRRGPYRKRTTEPQQPGY